MTNNEAMLLQRFATGADAEAFAELVRRYLQLVYATSWRVVKNESDATDVTQETFFELTRQAGRISGSLACWLHRVATQKSIDVIRRRVHRRRREQVYARSRPVEVRSWNDLSGRVDQALEHLDEATRALLLEHFIKGKTTSRLAAEQGCSQATMSRRINAGLEQLRGLLRRKGLLVATATLGTMLADNAAQAISGAAVSGLGKMAMVGTTRAATGVAKATVVKAVLAVATLIGTLSVAASVHHMRSSRLVPEPLASVPTEATPPPQSEGALTGFASVASPPGQPVMAVDLAPTPSAPSDPERTWSGQPGAGPFAALSNGVAFGAMAAQGAPRNPARTLHFPDDQSVGVVYLQDEDLVIPETVKGFHPGHAYAEAENYSWARGEVRIPAGKRVTLCIRGIGVTPQRYLKAINALDPNDLYGLQFFAMEPVTIPDHLIAPIARLTGLRRLGLGGIRLSPRALAQLAQLPRIEQLSTPLELADAGMDEIVQMKSLRILRIARDRLTDRGLRLVGHLENLESLDLYGNARMTDAGLETLTDLRWLRHVRLGKEGPFTDRAMAHLAQLPALKVLWLDTHNVTDRGLRELARSRSLERLCVHWLDTITGRGVAYVAKTPQLKGLDVSSARLGDADLASLADMPKLEHLVLPAGFTDAGIQHLAHLDHLKYLWVSCVGNSPLTDKALASICHLRELETLYIGGTGFTNEGIRRLGEIEGLSSLHIVFWPGLDGETLQVLAQCRGLRELSWTSSDHVTLSQLNVLNKLADLEDLHVSDIRPDSATLDLSGLKKLKRLRLSMHHEVDRAGTSYEVTYNTLRDSDLACLSGLTELEDLSLVGRGLTDAGLAHLAPLTRLKYLQYSGGPNVTDAALRHLASMRRLDTLTISDCRIGQQGLRSLYPLKTLHIIRLHSSVPISQQAVLRLRMELPHLQSLTLVPWEPSTRPARQMSVIGQPRARARTTSMRTPIRSTRGR